MTTRPTLRRFDPRFALHQRQPRADKLDARQRHLCTIDTAYKNALGQRVANAERFSAFLAVNRRSIGTPDRRAKGTPLALHRSIDVGRGFRAAGGVGRA